MKRYAPPALLSLAALAASICLTPAAPAGATGWQPDTLREAAPGGFVVGTAVAGGGHHEDMPYPEPFPNDRKYRHLVGKEFGSVSPENQMKWEYLHPEPDVYNFGPADAIVKFAAQRGQQVRGHTLLWHSQNPEWLEQGDYTPDELRTILRDHITKVVGRYQGQIDQWDVANEIFDDAGNLRTSNNIWIRELGPGIIADAFRWTHEADPDALLFFNDYGVESINRKSNAYYQLVQELRADGVPVDGFSVQGHLSTRYGFPGDLQANLQRFDALGLETAVTELDVRMDLPNGAEPTPEQEAVQATYYQRFLQACLAVEGCDSFTLWGFTDKYSWVPVFFPNQGSATVMTEEFERKPAYDSLLTTLNAARVAQG